MHTLKKRAVKFATLASTYTFALIAAISLSSLVMNNRTPECNLSVNRVGSGGRHLEFTPNLSLEKEFNYNTREVYLYLVQEEQASNGEKNQYVVWDAIVRPWSPKKFYSTVGNKYSIYGALKGSELVLKGNYFSYLGAMKTKVYGSKVVE